CAASAEHDRMGLRQSRRRAHADADADGRRCPRQASGSGARARLLRRSRRREQGVARSRLLLPQRDVGVESLAAISRLARMADGRNRRRNGAGRSAARLLTGRSHFRQFLNQALRGADTLDAIGIERRLMKRLMTMAAAVLALAFLAP